MVPDFVTRTGGSKWQSALPTGSEWESALPTGGLPEKTETQKGSPNRGWIRGAAFFTLPRGFSP